MDSEQAQIRNRIEFAVQEWRTSTTRPRFTAEQLLLMALMHGQCALTLQDAFKWVIRMFPYYQDLLAEIHFEGAYFSGPPDDKRKEIKALRSNIIDAVSSFEFPFERMNDNIQARLDRWICPARDSTILLHSFLGEPDSKPTKGFNFFGLPVEIRDLIYDMVFAYPRCGLIFEWQMDTRLRIKDTFSIRSRSYQHRPDLAEWEPDRAGYWSMNQDTFTTGRFKDILAPLMTCRQFHDEAMPAFFRINHFCFWTPVALFAFLHNVGGRRAQHLTQVTLTLTVTGLESPAAVTGVRLLSELEHLRVLSLCFNESRYMAEYDFSIWDTESNDPLRGLTALPELRRIRGLKEVNFVGPCPLLEKALKRSMCAPKVLESKRAHALKKRKAKQDNKTSGKKHKTKSAT